MELLTGFWNYGVTFLVILTVVVFVHELGHYLVARWNGVKVETFSIGFGPEIWGRTAKDGTRWKISLLPLGGYVKMFGDADPASFGHSDTPMSAEQRAQAFFHKRVGQRAAIVAAGPLANLAFAIIVLAGMFMIYGQPRTTPIIGEVMPDTPAAVAGLQAGDEIVRAEGQTIDRFQDLQRIVRMKLDGSISLTVMREGQPLDLTITPRIQEMTDALGNVSRVPIIGIRAGEGQTSVISHNPLTATGAAVEETWNIITATLQGIGQMISGTRPAEELGGPIRIAKGAGQAASLGVASVVFYTILLSINLGLINLFPVPLLDGGHLVYYAVEAIRGRPLGMRAQEYGFRVGLFLVFALMIFATRNDLVDLKVWDFLKSVVS